MKKACRLLLKIISILFLSAFLFLILGFFAHSLGLTNVAGEEDGNSFAYNDFRRSALKFYQCFFAGKRLNLRGKKI